MRRPLRRSRLAAGLPLAAIAALSAPLPAQAEAGPVAAWVDGQLDELETFYRDLHRHPELSFHEDDTAARLAKALRARGVEVTTGVGGTGLVGVLRSGDGPVGMLRADLDALPIAEETGLPYASTIRAESADGRAIGVMHACGHDLHMTNLLGTAAWFAAHPDQWSGTLLFLGQPAEERAGGAKAMLADGLFERFPRPAFGLALHCEPLLPTGTIGTRPGPLMAAVDSVDVTLFGRGGHGAAPHRTIDPIVLAAQYVLALQTIVSREIDPVQPALITVGSIHAGSKHNIISDRCQLQLTVRSYDPAVRTHLHDAIVRKAEALAAAAGAPPPTVEFSEPTGPLVNDDAVTATVQAALREALGDAHVATVPPQMVAEDFGRFGAAGIPICMLRLGVTAPDRLAALQAAGGPPALHSSGFYPDARDALATGVPATVAALRALLAR
ncbi:MAG: amidohydrolase [Planctomycetota bacterium]